MESKLPRAFINWQARTSAEKLASVLLKKLSAKGFKKSYIVGGYVRDLLLGLKKTGAIDIATEATPEQIKIALKGYKVIPTGIKHGTVTVHKGSDDIEITTFRSESRYSDFRRPDKVSFVRDPRLDAGRRDFTVNAFYFNLITGEFLDFHHGLRDLAQRKLRFIGSAKRRIEEDPLRLMRATRFVATMGFGLGSGERSAVKAKARLILKISPERIKQELDKITASPNRSAGIGLLHSLGLLKQIAPELDRLSRTVHSKNFHSEGNVFLHTLLALDTLAPDANLRTAYGLLLHDIGKAVTSKRTKKDNRFHVTYYGHQEQGEAITRQLLQRLRFSHAEIEEIAWYVRHHHVPYELPKMRKAKQMRWALDPRFENLLKLYRADSLASIPTDRRGKKLKPQLTSYNRSFEIWRSAHDQPEFEMTLLDGHDVMRTLKLKPGPRIGKILEKIRDLQLSGKLTNKKQALAHLKKIK